MSITEILMISIGLAMDSFAISICKGLSMKKMNWKKALIIALYFSAFQAGMPIIGYFLGNSFKSFIENIDHWIAFVLLSIIGLNMIKSSFDDENENENKNDNINFKTMIILAIATSIDALVVGVTFAFFKVNLLFAFLSIGIITFILSIIGVKIGNRFGDKFQNKAEFIGGLILIIMGLKILLEHIGII